MLFIFRSLHFFIQSAPFVQICLRFQFICCHRHRRWVFCQSRNSRIIITMVDAVYARVFVHMRLHVSSSADTLHNKHKVGKQLVLSFATSISPSSVIFILFCTRDSMFQCANSTTISKIIRTCTLWTANLLSWIDLVGITCGFIDLHYRLYDNGTTSNNESDTRKTITILINLNTDVNEMKKINKNAQCVVFNFKLENFHISLSWWPDRTLSYWEWKTAYDSASTFHGNFNLIWDGNSYSVACTFNSSFSLTIVNVVNGMKIKHLSELYLFLSWRRCAYKFNDSHNMPGICQPNEKWNSNHY